MKTGAIPDGGARKASSPAEPRLYGGRTLAQCCEFAGKLRRAGFHETPSIITDLAIEIEQLQARLDAIEAQAEADERAAIAAREGA